jgi:hypothetical protein
MKKTGILALSITLALASSVNAQSVLSASKPGAITSLDSPVAASPFAPNATITQGFELVGTANPTCVLDPALVTQGWFAKNNAAPVGTTCVFNGGAGTTFPAQAGTATQYAAYNFNNSVGTGDISTWFVSPRVTFGTGAKLEFWTRAAGTFADRLEVRTSTAADTGTPNVGTALTDVGTFTNLVLTVNPALTITDIACPTTSFTALASTIGGFPNTAWCKVTIEGAALPASGTGRVAFRYQVTNAGPGGDNSNFMGIDTFSFVEGITSAPIVSMPRSGSTINFSVPVGGTTSQTINFTGGPATLNCSVTGPYSIPAGGVVNVPGSLVVTASGAAGGTLTCTGPAGFTTSFALGSTFAVQAPALNMLGMLALLAGIALVGTLAVRRFS